MNIKKHCFTSSSR